MAFRLTDAEQLTIGRTSSRFVWRGVAFELPLGGAFNVSNALAAATAAALLDIDVPVIAEGIRSAGPVPGRFESIDVGQPYGVIVDYAHTPDGLARVLDSARAGLAAGGRVIVVFGCGGDRDRGKRPLMGEVATRMADVAILTSDNPRSEDPHTIIEEARAGARHPERLTIEVDRRAAIALAISGAAPGDIVVVAGKGHETGQDIGGVVTPFDDRAVVADEIRGVRR